MSNTAFSWISYYTELADKLIPYRNNRPALIDQITRAFSDADLEMPKLDNGVPTDIDPFTVFGLFNKMKLKDDKRRAILGSIGARLGVTAPMPDDFDGVPVLFPMSATFYRFEGERGSEDINILWDIFAKALNYADQKTAANASEFALAFDKAFVLPQVKWKLTMGLYWVRPYAFINLDNTNKSFLKKAFDLSISEYIKGEEYLNIIGYIMAAMSQGEEEFHNLPELSHTAWQEGKAQQTESVADEDSPVNNPQIDPSVSYWLYSPGENASMWDSFYEEGIMAIGWHEIGNLTQYSSRDEMIDAMKKYIDSSFSYTHTSLTTWDFLKRVKPGDVVLAKRGMSAIVGCGIVESDYEYQADRADKYPNVRRVRWTHKGNWETPQKIAQKTLTDITRNTKLVEMLTGLIGAVAPQGEVNNEIGEPENPSTDTPKAYTREDFLRDVYIDGAMYDELVAKLLRKRNIILQGPPGVGKTFAADRLAYSIMGYKDPSRIKMIQFHQSYSYEDFIMGYRPNESGFEIVEGPFYRFCKEAEKHPNEPYFFIIDEINRGNLSKIFGELFMLVEGDKRHNKLSLLYRDEEFGVPKNLYIIGMMNTADRSLAMIDFALRRRFAFFTFQPAFSSAGFEKYLEEKNLDALVRVVDIIEELNGIIAADDTLGRGFTIGHSYFCTDGEVDISWLASVINYEIAPLLEEYWFDEPDKCDRWVRRLREALQ